MPGLVLDLEHFTARARHDRGKMNATAQDSVASRVLALRSNATNDEL
jgi:hypothetical protein